MPFLPGYGSIPEIGILADDPGELRSEKTDYLYTLEYFPGD